ncbi:AcrR family transcriptional regulator [Rhodoblastus acidophilus]|uniref:TetR/AcrR family transcriptional regulator n=1 Tax=Rhodoblastus acidophilus TaxID=1074 RepID=UPI002224AAA4|nr:WHG domain-containing protein [Rhodoblastus acidophilus]MCW2282541.1 AcrR family transcriptional regulator [Rhodoblastus acidophilus]MCW2331402.1 AcrR family transcriptional regulator [Rhodoblastus acidophilus]
MGRRSYHHGRLREALIAAARALISERGLAGFTLAEAAKRVGVTGAAPYRHFADRDALVAALAQDGFSHFNQLLGRAWDGGKPDPVAALRRRGEAYLAFARDEPGLYRAMFGDAGPSRRPADGAARAAFDEQVRACVDVLRFFHAPERDAETLAMQIWAMSHGVADLMLSGHFEGPEQANKILDSGVAALVEGAMRKALGIASVIPAG